MTMQLNFFADMAAHCRAELAAAGLTTAAADDRATVLAYFAAARRFIPPKARTVHIAPALQCPPALQAGYDLLRQKAAAGAPLRPHQSTRVADADYNDTMLNDWGIDHFHLGVTVDGSGWMKRTGPLLFARVTDEDFYCITIQAHGAWAQQQMIETIHQTWPDTIKAYRIHGAIALQNVLSDADIATLRKHHINGMLQLSDGTIYGGPGLGYSANGASTAAALQTNALFREGRTAEKLVREHMAAGLRAIIRIDAPSLEDDDIDFHLEFDTAGNLIAVEKTTRIALNFGKRALAPIR